jgi:hypothetical protein
MCYNKTMTKKKMGRPVIVIDQEQMAVICRLKPTLKDCADYFGVSEDTIDNNCKKWGFRTFSDFRDKKMVHTRFSLIRKAIDMGLKGDRTMLIFSLKNLCGWGEKNEQASLSEREQLVDYLESEKQV